MDIKSTNRIIKILSSTYPNPKPTLNWNSPFECLIAVILSAQCTDAKVNKVAKDLFKIANTPEKMTKLGQQNLAKIIKPCGLYKTKSKNIIGTSKKIITDFKNKVPNTLTKLVSLPGVGEKTAKVVMTQIFKNPYFPVDTHIHRIANRLGLCQTKTASETSACLESKIPKKYWHNLHLQLIFHGRKICKARHPLCHSCDLANLCDATNNNCPRPTKRLV